MRLHKMLENETQQKEKLEGEIATLHSQLLQLSLTADEVKNTQSSFMYQNLFSLFLSSNIWPVLPILYIFLADSTKP